MKIVYFSIFMLFLFSIFGILLIGIIYHELMHLDLNSNLVSNEAICFDLTGEETAFAILNKTEMYEYYGYVEQDKMLSDHFMIYYNEGLLEGLITGIVIMEFGALIIYLKLKPKEVNK